ncbi:MAG: DNA-processing protein DprA [Bdellovibrionota bacterium]
MKPVEFLSILSTQVSGVNLKSFQKLHSLIDIYDLKKDPRMIFGDQLPEKLSENWFDKVLHEYDLFQKNNIHHIYPDHPLYPKDFKTLEKPPLFLSMLGDISCLNRDKISVVGSRYPTSAVLEWMDVYLDPIVKDDIVIVSGAARGIDQKAHSISLKSSKPTIAFLPSGLGEIYPKEFARWKDRITDCGGLLISEYAHDQSIHSHHFHERNRMIAKLGLFLLVCEARRKSGSTMTARLAIENSKTVCVLPGFPTSKNSQGCLDLLFQGALPIRDSDDLKVLIEAEKMSTQRNLQRNLFIPDLFQGIERSYKE